MYYPAHVESLLFLTMVRLEECLRQDPKALSPALFNVSSRGEPVHRSHEQLRESLAPLVLPVLASIHNLAVSVAKPMLSFRNIGEADIFFRRTRWLL